MARKCKLTGKGPLVGNNVSHANNRTKRRQLPNLMKKRIFIPELDKWVRVKLTASAMRTMAKKGGLLRYLKDLGMTLRDVT